MYLNKINLFLVINICLIFFFITYNDVKSYEIKIIDGDTIHLNNEKIRFTGMDTPELKQTCNKNNEIIFDSCDLTSLYVKKKNIRQILVTKKSFILFKYIVKKITNKY